MNIPLCLNVSMWRNRYTRTFEGRVEKSLRVQVPPSTPLYEVIKYLCEGRRTPMRSIYGFKRGASRVRSAFAKRMKFFDAKHVGTFNASDSRQSPLRHHKRDVDLCQHLFYYEVGSGSNHLYGVQRILARLKRSASGTERRPSEKTVMSDYFAKAK